MFYFICACGCGEESKPLGREYMRLPKGKKWVTKGHEKEKELWHPGKVIREFKGGMIIEQEEF